MKLIYLIASLSLMLMSCDINYNNKFDGLLNRQEDSHFKRYLIFDDKNYLLTLTTIDTTTSYNIDRPTIIFNLLKRNNDKIDTLVYDSLFSRNPLGAVSEISIEFKDFNFDGINDIVIPYGTDPRGNTGFHLYITDNKNKQIHRVNGFTDIANPKPDSTYKMIQSFVLAGPPFCRFFEINSKNELIDLEHYLEIPDLDSIDTKILRQMRIITTIR